MTGLTPMQARVLAAIRELTRDGVPPTLEELAVALGLSGKSQVHKHVAELKVRGRVDWIPRRARSLHIVERRAIAREDLLAQTDQELLRIVGWAREILAARP